MALSDDAATALAPIYEAALNMEHFEGIEECNRLVEYFNTVALARVGDIKVQHIRDLRRFMTATEIGQALGVSRQRIQQITDK